jgi:pilus assembly protein Flp/PilA
LPRIKLGAHVLRGDEDMTTFKQMLANDDGATAIEYGLIAALIAVAAITALTSIGGNLNKTFTNVADNLNKTS